MSFTSLAVKIAAPLPKIEQYDRYLFIGPHPDDIEIGAGATAAKLASEGKTVAFLVCCDGRFGDGASGGVKGDALAALRKEEAVRSAAYLGIKDVRFLDLCDGGFYRKEEMIDGIARAVGDFAPDMIFAPDPLSKSESHPDHLNAGLAARRIANFAPYPGIMERYGAKTADVKAIAFYMTAHPNRYVKTSPALLTKQKEAVFDIHKSQYPDGSDEAKSISLYLSLRSGEFGVRNLCRAAEGFRVQGRTQMHCLPEAE